MRRSTRAVLIRATCFCREEEERAEACEGYDDYGDRRFDLRSAGLLCRLAHNTRGVAGACIFVCYQARCFILIQLVKSSKSSGSRLDSAPKLWCSLSTRNSEMSDLRG